MNKVLPVGSNKLKMYIHIITSPFLKHFFLTIFITLWNRAPRYCEVQKVSKAFGLKHIIMRLRAAAVKYMNGIKTLSDADKKHYITYLQRCKEKENKSCYKIYAVSPVCV